MRTDLYGLVHKAQRYQLFAFAQRLAHADWADASYRSTMERSVRRLAEMLRDHAQNEHRYIHPLFEAIGEAAEPLELDHRTLEDDVAAWIAVVDEQRWEQLYGVTMCLIGKYLLHIDAEERAQERWLWPRYTDAQLGDVMARFRAERPSVAARADLELFITSLGTLDLVKFLRGFSSAPSDVRQNVMNLAQELLGAERWAGLAARL